jgi:hypothetical protein
MKKTLIAMLAAAAISLPALAQQTDPGQGQGQGQGQQNSGPGQQNSNASQDRGDRSARAMRRRSTYRGHEGARSRRAYHRSRATFRDYDERRSMSRGKKIGQRRSARVRSGTENRTRRQPETH